MNSKQFYFFFVCVTGLLSCKKDGKSDACFSSSPTVRQIINQPAIVKTNAAIIGAYLVEDGSIDTKLIPCNLPMEFYQNDLQVVISGEVKATMQGVGPCCSENFYITKIAR